MTEKFHRGIEVPRTSSENENVTRMFNEPNTFFDIPNYKELIAEINNDPELIKNIIDDLRKKDIETTEEEIKRIINDRYVIGEIEDDFVNRTNQDIVMTALRWHEENREASKANQLFNDEAEEILKELKEEVLKREDIKDWGKLSLKAAELQNIINQKRIKKGKQPITGLSTISALIKFIDPERQADEMDYEKSEMLPRLIKRNKKTAIEETIKKQKEIKNVINTDSLTGAYSRDGIKEQLELTIKELESKKDDAKEVGEGLVEFKCAAVVSFDINSFKKINDTQGHDVGDEVLKKVVAVLRDTVRSSDIIGRQSGDEYTVILKDVKYKIEKSKLSNLGSKEEQEIAKDEAAETVINTILHRDIIPAIEKIDIPNAKKSKRVKKGEITITGGARIIRPGEKNLDPATIINEADQCTLIQKEDEPGKIAIFSDKIEQTIMAKISTPEGRAEWAKKKVYRTFKRRFEKMQSAVENAEGPFDKKVATANLLTLNNIIEKEVEIEIRELERKITKATMRALRDN